MKYLVLGVGSLLLIVVVTGMTILLDPYFKGGHKYSIEGLWLLVFLVTVLVPVGIYSYRADSGQFAVGKLRKKKRQEKPIRWTANRAKKQTEKTKSKRQKRREVEVHGDIRLNSKHGRQMLF
ncbi:MAG: hypothetical protein P1V97_19985, partial [Planctomycetota bacterium]|nr:hypothetical protein [Planctomycetota bacterium]